jgi:hypothetical protein
LAFPRQIPAVSTEPPSEPDPNPPRPAEPAEPGVPEVPAAESGWPPSIPEQPIPRGCNPLVFGVVMATIQLACTVYLMRSC